VLRPSLISSKVVGSNLHIGVLANFTDALDSDFDFYNYFIQIGLLWRNFLRVHKSCLSKFGEFLIYDQSPHMFVTSEQMEVIQGPSNGSVMKEIKNILTIEGLWSLKPQT
jgi:hypothetical protein